MDKNEKVIRYVAYRQLEIRSVVEIQLQVRY